MAFPDGLKGPPARPGISALLRRQRGRRRFARALVLEVEKTTCVDRSRIYAVGVLTGGGMAYYLACRAADLFAAVAPAAFDLLQENVGDCAPAAPITVVSFRGTAIPSPVRWGRFVSRSWNANNLPRGGNDIPEMVRNRWMQRVAVA